MRVQTGANVGIGGFIITGSAPMHVLLRAIGPSLAQSGVPDALADTVLELHGPGAFVTITNDNWRDDPVQEAAIIATGIPPTNNLESAIDTTLNPGAYTAIISGKNNTSGVGLVEVYDLSQAVPAKLANISTRAFVSTGDNVVIAGFILGNHNGNDRIVVRGLGPSLTAAGVPNALANPTLELRDSNGVVLIANNDWQDNPAQAAELTAAGLAPTNNLESGIAATLSPGLYTALLAGVNNGTGVGLVEVYDRGGGSGRSLLSTAHTFAAVVNATYTTGAEVPVSSNGFTATGKTVNFTLNYAPTTGTQLMVVQNTGLASSAGTFSNLAQGQTVALSYGGVTYNFVANYHGGTGNDLVLLWTSDKKSLPAATLKKLDAQNRAGLEEKPGKSLRSANRHRF